MKRVIEKVKRIANCDEASAIGVLTVMSNVLNAKSYLSPTGTDKYTPHWGQMLWRAASATLAAPTGGAYNGGSQQLTLNRPSNFYGTGSNGGYWRFFGDRYNLVRSVTDSTFAIGLKVGPAVASRDAFELRQLQHISGINHSMWNVLDPGDAAATPTPAAPPCHWSDFQPTGKILYFGKSVSNEGMFAVNNSTASVSMTTNDHVIMSGVFIQAYDTVTAQTLDRFVEALGLQDGILGGSSESSFFDNIMALEFRR